MPSSGNLESNFTWQLSWCQEGLAGLLWMRNGLISGQRQVLIFNFLQRDIWRSCSYEHIICFYRERGKPFKVYDSWLVNIALSRQSISKVVYDNSLFRLQQKLNAVKLLAKVWAKEHEHSSRQIEEVKSELDRAAIRLLEVGTMYVSGSSGPGESPSHQAQKANSSMRSLIWVREAKSAGWNLVTQTILQNSG